MAGQSCDRRLLIILNPTAGGRRPYFEAVLAQLRGLGCQLTVRTTNGCGDAERLAAAADPGRYDRIVVAGGDGTINDAVNGLNGARMPLAIVPLGTANVLAAEIGLANDPRSVALAIATGPPRPISLGMANGRRFILMAGVGFDAHVVDTVDLALKRRFGKIAYVLATLRQLLRFGFPDYRVRIGDSVMRVASVLVANARCYGGRFVCAPQASLQSPTLQVCLFERTGRLSAIGYALALMTGRLPKLRSYRILSAERIEIQGPPGEPIQGDGDIIGTLDAEIVVLPQALHLIYPPRPS